MENVMALLQSQVLDPLQSWDSPAMGSGEGVCYASVDSSSGSGSGSGFGNVATSEDFEDLFFSVPRASPTNKVPSYQTPTTTSSGTLKYFSLNVLVLVILIKWALS
ncbi:UNVERIFIED_CONTAM: hypothetical protein NCL1_18331 [Trichonephila clavipes]